MKETTSTDVKAQAQEKPAYDYHSKYYWLNDESRKFLSRGYLDETPEQRIKDIANTAEKYLKIDGFAKKFKFWVITFNVK